MSFLDKIFGGGLNAVADIVKDIFDTPAAKAEWLRRQEEHQWRIDELDREALEKQQELQLEYYKLDAVDRGNARDLGKVEIQSGDIFVRRFKYFLAAGCILAIMVVLSLVIFIPLPEKSENIALIIIGSLTTTLTGIIQYFFGSSQGSAAKAETIDNVIKSKADESLG